MRVSSVRFRQAAPRVPRTHRRSGHGTTLALVETRGHGAGMSTYLQGHHESVLRSHRWRTVENSAAYVAPHVREGMSVLDVGCGPGTITRELGELVGAPGSVVGVDTSADVLAAAAEECAAPNVRVVVGDALELPFPDGTFDVAHAHQVLQHLTDPVAALTEMGRVVRPGGLVAVRDADYAAMSWHPAVPGLESWREVYRAVARQHGGQPDAVDGSCPGLAQPASPTSSPRRARGASRRSRTARGGAGCRRSASSSRGSLSRRWFPVSPTASSCTRWPPRGERGPLPRTGGSQSCTVRSCAGSPSGAHEHGRTVRAGDVAGHRPLAAPGRARQRHVPPVPAGAGPVARAVRRAALPRGHAGAAPARRGVRRGALPGGHGARRLDHRAGPGCRSRRRPHRLRGHARRPRRRALDPHGRAPRRPRRRLAGGPPGTRVVRRVRPDRLRRRGRPAGPARRCRPRSSCRPR